MKNCTCDKLNCDASCLCECHRDEELKADLIKFDEGLKELVPEIFPKGESRIHRVSSPLDKAIVLGIERMQKYDLKVITK